MTGSKGTPLKLQATYVSVGEFDDHHFEVSFDTEDPGAAFDLSAPMKPYLLIQRQFEDGVDGAIFISPFSMLRHRAAARCVDQGRSCGTALGTHAARHQDRGQAGDQEAARPFAGRRRCYRHVSCRRRQSGNAPTAGAPAREPTGAGQCRLCGVEAEVLGMVSARVRKSLRKKRTGTRFCAVV
jgi:hypothetical protein